MSVFLFYFSVKFLSTAFVVYFLVKSIPELSGFSEIHEWRNHLEFFWAGLSLWIAAGPTQTPLKYKGLIPGILQAVLIFSLWCGSLLAPGDLEFLGRISTQNLSIIGQALGLLLFAFGMHRFLITSAIAPRFSPLSGATISTLFVMTAFELGWTYSLVFFVFQWRLLLLDRQATLPGTLLGFWCTLGWTSQGLFSLPFFGHSTQGLWWVRAIGSRELTGGTGGPLASWLMLSLGTTLLLQTTLRYTQHKYGNHRSTITSRPRR